MDFGEILRFFMDVMEGAWSIQSEMFNQAGGLFLATFIGLFVTYTIVRFFIARALVDFGSSDSAIPVGQTDFSARKIQHHHIKPSGKAEKIR